jgi:hypothetical protein
MNQAEEPGGADLRPYRIELEGALDAAWSDWFDARVVSTAGGRTVLETAPIDQAELHGVLRRLHDMHLRLVSVVDVRAAATGRQGKR